MTTVDQICLLLKISNWASLLVSVYMEIDKRDLAFFKLSEISATGPARLSI